MYDNSTQRNALLPLVLSTVGFALVRMVVRRLRADRSAARGEAAPGPRRPQRHGARTGRRAGGAGRRRRAPVL